MTDNEMILTSDYTLKTASINTIKCGNETIQYTYLGSLKPAPAWHSSQDPSVPAVEMLEMGGDVEARSLGNNQVNTLRKNMFVWIYRWPWENVSQSPFISASVMEWNYLNAFRSNYLIYSLHFHLPLRFLFHFLTFITHLRFSIPASTCKMTHTHTQWNDYNFRSHFKKQQAQNTIKSGNETATALQILGGENQCNRSKRSDSVKGLKWHKCG